ncbi:PPE family protein [Mycobacterium lepromatosis]|uniref:PPE family protein n=1 Tax=Mycobacterium lepromatosis TaxID=480418 RepID=A0A0F4ETA2_9MYCO|nr:PPE family protein [Mycobacterium lepromatosis]KJX74860.1 PPE family protein [Mycobacterium lepromatosis]UKN42667.1 PPE family protein [Mycobacterium lepromatosis]
MSSPIWMASPPEVHSALLSSGPGSGPLLVAAEAWRSLSSVYAETADELVELLIVIPGRFWAGSAAEAYVIAHLPYIGWLRQASVDSAVMAAQHETVAIAYTTTLAMMPTLAELAANRTAHTVLVATNFFGINAIPIVRNETDYVRMWVEAAIVMGTYQEISTVMVDSAPEPIAAPQIMASDALEASSDQPSPTAPSQPPQVQNWLQWLQRIGYTDFYNNVVQPLITSLTNHPFFQAMFSGFDPWLPSLGNPLSFLSPFNIAFALGTPMDIGSYIGYLSQTFAFIGADLAAAFASGNPVTIGFTMLFTTIEAIGTIITDTIALVKTLIEQSFVLLPVILPLLTTPLAVATAGAAGSFAGLSGLAGLVGVAPLALPSAPPVTAVAPVVPPLMPTLASPPIPVPAPAAATAPVVTPGPPPVTAPPSVTGAGMESFEYLVGRLPSTARRAVGTSVRQQASAPERTEAPEVAATLQEQAQSRRRLQAKVTPFDSSGSPNAKAAPTASDQGAGTLGLAGTARQASSGPATGLVTLPNGTFSDSPRAPMLPRTWGDDPAFC